MDNLWMYLSFCIYFQKLSINTQSQFQDDNKKHERGVFYFGITNWQNLHFN